MRIHVAVKLPSLAKWHLKGTWRPEPTGCWDLESHQGDAEEDEAGASSEAAV